MTTRLEALSGTLFHPLGDIAAGVLGGTATATHPTIIGWDLIDGVLMPGYTMDPEAAAPEAPRPLQAA